MEQTIAVEETKAQLLATIEGHAIPSSTYPRKLVKLQYGTEDLTSYAVSLSFVGTGVVIICQLPADYAHQPTIDRADPLQHLWGEPLTGVTDLGETFGARAAYSLTFTFDGGGYRVTVSAEDWQLVRESPCLWAGQLTGGLPSGPGNLNLRIGTDYNASYSRSHFGLLGARWTYFLLAKGKRKLADTLVIDTKGEAFDSIVLNGELLALSYCLGHPVQCSFLVGLDAYGETVAYAGGNYGFDRLQPNHDFAPVPRAHFQSWFTLLFRHLTRTLAAHRFKKRSEFLYEAIKLYVESSAEVNNTSREVKALLACLTVARWFGEQPPLLVQSPTKWKRWATTSQVLRTQAAEGYEELLRARVAAASQLGPVEIIHMALQRAQLPLEPKLLGAVGVSSQLAAGQLVGVNYPESQLRCLCLRALCAGMVAVAVGYAGPLAGWNTTLGKHLGNKVADTDWFPVDSTVRPLQFIAHAASQLPTAKLTELWPTFERPAVPEGSLVSLIENFARNLASRTGEQVRARVVPLPVFDVEEPRLYDFVLESVLVPLASTVLFTVRQAGQQVPLDVLSWDEEVPVITDERALTHFLGQVARADRTRHAIERLLLLVPSSS